MKLRNVERLTPIALFALFLLLTKLPTVGAQRADPPKALQISMAKTFVHDQPEIFVDIFAGEFNAVMKTATGMNGDLRTTDSPDEIAAKIHANQLDFGIVHAHEFAWLRAKYPDLLPLLTAKEKDKHACLIVHKDSPAKAVADLRGKNLDLPRGSKEYCRAYLGKMCADEMNCEPVKFFGTLAKSASQFDALDQVARKKADATIIDSIWLGAYKEIKGPVFAKNLRVLKKSIVIPPAVIIYRKEGLPQATVDRVRAGLLRVHDIPRGRLLLALWHVDAFEEVPTNYAKRLDEVAKEFAAPRPPR